MGSGGLPELGGALKLTTPPLLSHLHLLQVREAELPLAMFLLFQALDAQQLAPLPGLAPAT